MKNFVCLFVYKYIQALAFVPEDDVLEAFLLLKDKSDAKFSPIIDYVEKYYIGKLVENSRTVRHVPNFPIPTWNLFNRILSDKPRATNSFEAWNSAIGPDIKNKMTVIDLFRKEQSNTETWLTQLTTGMEHKVKKSSVEHNRRIKSIVESYDNTDLMGYLKTISLIL